MALTGEPTVGSSSQRIPNPGLVVITYEPVPEPRLAQAALHDKGRQAFHSA